MSRKTELVILFIFALIVAGAFFVNEHQLRTVEAQSPQEVAPYVFATTPDGTNVFKMVHQGCELFLAERHKSEIKYGDAVSVSITTGRGCK